MIAPLTGQLERAMPLPPKAAATLSLLRVRVGTVWKLPGFYAQFENDEPRYCLIVAVEQAPGSNTPARVHFICGSRNKGGPPVVVAKPQEVGQPDRTYFRFFTSGSIEPTKLINVGKYTGALAPERLGEIEEAIPQSKLGHLKRLLK